MIKAHAPLNQMNGNTASIRMPFLANARIQICILHDPIDSDKQRSINIFVRYKSFCLGHLSFAGRDCNISHSAASCSGFSKGRALLPQEHLLLCSFVSVCLFWQLPLPISVWNISLWFWLAFLKLVTEHFFMGLLATCASLETSLLTFACLNGVLWG